MKQPSMIDYLIMSKVHINNTQQIRLSLNTIQTLTIKAIRTMVSHTSLMLNTTNPKITTVMVSITATRIRTFNLMNMVITTITIQDVDQLLNRSSNNRNNPING